MGCPPALLPTSADRRAVADNIGRHRLPAHGFQQGHGELPRRGGALCSRSVQPVLRQRKSAQSQYA
eukprot:1893444-Alexandrium_andersonii.AAC.1